MCCPKDKKNTSCHVSKMTQRSFSHAEKPQRLGLGDETHSEDGSHSTEEFGAMPLLLDQQQQQRCPFCEWKQTSNSWNPTLNVMEMFESENRMTSTPFTSRLEKNPRKGRGKDWSSLPQNLGVLSDPES